MLTERIEKLGLGPIKEMLKSIGGWPVIEAEKWNESKFTWMDSMYNLIVPGKEVIPSTPKYLFEVWVGPDFQTSKANNLLVSYFTLIQYYSIRHKTRTIKYLHVVIMCRVLNHKHFHIHTVCSHESRLL